MLLFKRLRRPLRLEVPAPTVADAVALIRQRESQLPRFSSGTAVRVQVKDDGWLWAGERGGRGPLVDLEGRLNPGGTGVVLHGVIREQGGAGLMSGFAVAGVVFVVLALLTVVAAGGLNVGFFFLLVAGLAFGGIGYAGLKQRPSVFETGCQSLVSKLDWLGTPDRQ